MLPHGDFNQIMAIYNGVKVFTYGGRDADENQTKEIEDYASKIDVDSIEEMDYDEAVSKELIKEIYPLNEYLDNIINAVDMQKIRNAGLRVALDPMYGVSEIPLKTLLHHAILYILQDNNIITQECHLDEEIFLYHQ